MIGSYYSSMFGGYVNLRALSSFSTIISTDTFYTDMFQNYSSINLSGTQTGECQRILTNGIETTISNTTYTMV